MSVSRQKPKVAPATLEIHENDSIVESETESVVEEDYSKMNNSELINLCKDRNIKGYSNKNKSQLIELLSGIIETQIKSNKKNKNLSLPDTYEESVLKERYYDFHSTYTKTILFKQKYELKIRSLNMYDDVSENIAKFIIKGREGKNVKWSKSINQSGDLYDCDNEQQLEIKTFMSDGPISFGPKEKWDIIYFLDARKILENTFILYCLPYSNISEVWKNIKVNSTTTFEEQADTGKRPRNNWESIKSQIGDKIIKIFEGTFDEIF
jgi:hypothetical protein